MRWIKAAPRLRSQSIPHPTWELASRERKAVQVRPRLVGDSFTARPGFARMSVLRPRGESDTPAPMAWPTRTSCAEISSTVTCLGIRCADSLKPGFRPPISTDRRRPTTNGYGQLWAATNGVDPESFGGLRRYRPDQDNRTGHRTPEPSRLPPRRRRSVGPRVSDGANAVAVLGAVTLARPESPSPSRANPCDQRARGIARSSPGVSAARSRASGQGRSRRKGSCRLRRSSSPYGRLLPGAPRAVKSGPGHGRFRV